MKRVSRKPEGSPELFSVRPVSSQRRPTPTILLCLGLVMVALNLRPTIAGFGPLLNQIQGELRVSASTLSLLTTIPLLPPFAATAPKPSCSCAC